MSIWMTDAEIVKSYEQAEDKKEQLVILSQLNACEQREIRDILIDNGVKLTTKGKTKQKKPSGRHRSYEEYDAMYRPLYESGMSDREISIRCCTSTGPVRNWRVRNNLPPNFASGWPKDARFGKEIPFNG